MIYRLSNVLLPILLLFLYVSSEVKSCDLFFSLEALISPQKANCRSTLPDGSIGNYRCKASNCITTGNLYKLPAGKHTEVNESHPSPFKKLSIVDKLVEEFMIRIRESDDLYVI
ncbi:hypothetical protein PPACK8108_LOCUS7846 [Phakopsora pachyrhizi]|uniref:Secreted protein n=1 Tax=Phakopsora pachyrhizi TaxID=170000 RepID=A0AAV0ATN2_PHAPC|nr:hypothetical protein PPACK8108_LOCUS7846 [Phakopsora pachyrhizi]